MKPRLDKLLMQRRHLAEGYSIAARVADAESPRHELLRLYLESRIRNSPGDATLFMFAKDYQHDRNLASKISELIAAIYLSRLTGSLSTFMAVDVEKLSKWEASVFTLNSGAHVQLAGSSTLQVKLRSQKLEISQFTQELAENISAAGIATHVQYGHVVLMLFEDSHEETTFKKGEPRTLLEALDAGVPIEDLKA